MICVDGLKAFSKWGKGSHLFSNDGDIDALHDFAKSLGLKREWFQNDKRLPHYDITESKRRKALRNGAKEASRKELVSILRRQGK